MDDINQLQSAMSMTLKNLGDNILKKEQVIEALKKEVIQETENFGRLFKSFMGLVDTDKPPQSQTKPLYNHSEKTPLEDILQTQQQVMKQSNPMNPHPPNGEKNV